MHFLKASVNTKLETRSGFDDESVEIPTRNHAYFKLFKSFVNRTIGTALTRDSSFIFRSCLERVQNYLNRSPREELQVAFVFAD